MPVCCVPFCKSITSTHHLFSFPKYEKTIIQWKNNIPRDDWVITKWTKICHLHFEPQFISGVERCLIKDCIDNQCEHQLKSRWRLRNNAVPTIFPNLPSYLNKKTPNRASPAIKILIKKELVNLTKRAELDDQKIKHLSEIILSDKYKIRNFQLNIAEDKLTFYKVCWVSKSPFIVASFSISRLFEVEIYINNIRQKITNYQDILGSKYKCDLYSKLNQIIMRLNEYKSEEKFVEDYKISIKTNLDALKNCEDVDEGKLLKLNFISEQFDLIFSNINRYSSDLIIFSSMMFYTYPAAYNYLRNSEYLILPNSKYLKTFSKGNLQSGAAKDYLVKKYSKLEPHEKYVNLLLDEVYVKPAMTFKGNKIEGLASNKSILESSLTVAKSIQAFMITSLLSKNKDIVGLYPVQKMDSDYLQSKIYEILEILHSVGYEVVSIISDNNQVNRKAFKKFSNTGNLPIFIDSPYVEGKQIFFLFDTVHLVKSVRNNWLNNKSRTFIFPNFENPNITLTSKVSHLESIYLKEKDLAVKLAPALAPKVLHPNSFERQNVSLALRMFDDKTIKAISCFRSILGEECLGTAEFLKIVRNWWIAVNVKTPSKGFRLREPLAVPITINNKSGLQFLEQFSRWLQNWDELKNCNKLTSETQSAMLHTTNTLCQIADYLLKTLKFKYVLFGKFQTDKLEARFGQYRQMSGCCYNVTVQQILQSEKKLKLLSLLKLVKSKNDFFNFKTNFSFTSSPTVEIVDLEDIISFAENISFDQETSSAMMYISGYVARKVTGKLNCDECVAKLITHEDLALEFNVETEYLKDLDRGGLKYPTELSICFGVCVYQIFKTLTSARFLDSFLSSSCHREYFFTVVLEYIDHLFLDEICQSCCTTEHEILKKCAIIWCNIFLNNYCKNQNNNLQSNNLAKRRKLNILDG